MAQPKDGNDQTTFKNGSNPDNTEVRFSKSAAGKKNIILRCIKKWRSSTIDEIKLASTTKTNQLKK